MPSKKKKKKGIDSRGYVREHQIAPSRDPPEDKADVTVPSSDDTAKNVVDHFVTSKTTTTTSVSSSCASVRVGAVAGLSSRASRHSAAATTTTSEDASCQSPEIDYRQPTESRRVIRKRMIHTDPPSSEAPHHEHLYHIWREICTTMQPSSKKDPPNPPDRSKISDFARQWTSLGIDLTTQILLCRHFTEWNSFSESLDWLCLEHLCDPSMIKIPEIFLERETSATSSVTSSLSVLFPTHPNADTVRDDSVDTNNPIPHPHANNVIDYFQDKVHSTAQSRMEHSDDSAKEWILQQYQYEEEEDPSQQDPDETLHLHERVIPNSSGDTDHNIRALQDQLVDMELDYANPANQYMRSRYENKAMKQEIQNLKRLIGKLQPKMERTPTQVTKVLSSTMSNGQTENDTNEDEHESGMFDIFATDISSAPKEETCNSPRISVPKNAIPRSWTGMTPFQVLEDRCKEEGTGPPKFSKQPNCGGRLSIRLLEEECLAFDVESAPSHEDAKHYLSTQALYKLFNNLPLYGSLPPVYRNLWLEWKAEEEKEREFEKRRVLDEHERSVDKLMEVVESSSICGKGHEKSESCFRSDLECQGAILGSERSPGKQKEERVIDDRASSELRDWFLKHRTTDRYLEMYEEREKLPIMQYREDILLSINRNTTTIIHAETGAGKTTQCPQFILEDALEHGQGVNTKILCTQPRRVAATSVSRRVSEELCEADLGGLVGYRIRLDSKSSKRTRLLFCTTGVVLRMLIDDPHLTGISHVVVDEVHERQWQIDILLVALRKLVKGPRKDLKIILMSATLDKSLFSSFFGDSPVLSIPGRTFPVESYWLEDVFEATGHLIEEGSYFADRTKISVSVSLQVTGRGGRQYREEADLTELGALGGKYESYSHTTQKSMSLVDEAKINYGLIEDVITHLVSSRNSFALPDGVDLSDNGAILVFLPGVGEIRTMMETLQSNSTLSSSTYNIIPMHSALSPNEQSRAFERPQKGRRSIILSTNMCETSVTIPNVVCVIDTGRERILTHDKRTSTRRLQLSWCSRASAKQRSGRAGRVQPGLCLKLFSRETESRRMKASVEPELRRIPLEEVLLNIIASGLSDDCIGFLNETPQPPDQKAVLVATNLLVSIGALERKNEDSSRVQLTPLGRVLSQLPIDVRLGKILVIGSLLGCLDTCMDVVACLSASQSPFRSSIESKHQAELCWRKFKDPSSKSDFTTYIELVKGFQEARSKGKARSFCRESFLSFATMNEIMNSKEQYLGLMSNLGLSWVKESKSPLTSNRLAHVAIAAGLYPNFGHVSRESKELVVRQKGQKLQMNRNSVNARNNSGLPSSFMCFFEKFATSKSTSIDVTAFVHPLVLLVFSSNVTVYHKDRIAEIDGFFKIPIAAQTAVVCKEIRKEIENVLSNPSEDSFVFQQLGKVFQSL